MFDLLSHAPLERVAFQPDPLSRRLSAQPLAKASTQLMALVNSLCAMLGTSPFHRENYARLILGVVIQFYQRCSDRFQALVGAAPEADEADPAAPVALGAQWAQRHELQACFSEMQEEVSPYILPTRTRIDLQRRIAAKTRWKGCISRRRSRRWSSSRGAAWKGAT